ncbi:MAG: hypothetical protein Q8M03_05950 [Legionella sp.]|nr:hypothetical protein [Legionella sp.]
MFTLTQVQYIFDYAMFSFYQCADKTRPEAVKRSAQVAAAATTMVNKEARMASKVRDGVTTAGLEAVILNKHLTGDAHREAFNIRFAISLKTGFEMLFDVENISEYDNTNTEKPILPVVEPEGSSPNELPATPEPAAKFNPQFFSSLPPPQDGNDSKGFEPRQ